MLAGESPCSKSGRASVGVSREHELFSLPGLWRCASYFGHGGAAELAVELNLPLLAEIPLEPLIREDSDSGLPAVLDPNSDTRRFLWPGSGGQ